jgi:hypothetical protein
LFKQELLHLLLLLRLACQQLLQYLLLVTLLLLLTRLLGLHLAFLYGQFLLLHLPLPLLFCLSLLLFLP